MDGARVSEGVLSMPSGVENGAHPTNFNRRPFRFASGCCSAPARSKVSSSAEEGTGGAVAAGGPGGSSSLVLCDLISNRMCPARQCPPQRTCATRVTALRRGWSFAAITSA